MLHSPAQVALTTPAGHQHHGNDVPVKLSVRESGIALLATVRGPYAGVAWLENLATGPTLPRTLANFKAAAGSVSATARVRHVALSQSLRLWHGAHSVKDDLLNGAVSAWALVTSAELFATHVRRRRRAGAVWMAVKGLEAVLGKSILCTEGAVDLASPREHVHSAMLTARGVGCLGAGSAKAALRCGVTIVMAPAMCCSKYAKSASSK